MAKPGRPITDHSEAGNAARAMRKLRKDGGLCVTCGRWAIHGYVLCPECRRKSVTAQAKLRHARQKAGLCTECGAQANGKARCPRCVERRNNRPSRTYAHRWRTEYQYRSKS